MGVGIADPEDEWTQQVTWDDYGTKAFWAVAGATYRMNGGTVGPVAYAHGVETVKG